MIQLLIDTFGAAQGWLFESLIRPLIHQSGFGAYAGAAFEGSAWLLVGLCELALLFLVLRPMEALIPVHKFNDRRARRNDFVYTVLHRVGLFPLLVFFSLGPLVDQLAGAPGFDGIGPLKLETLWPAQWQQPGPVALFLVYLVVLDFADYWYHRASHGFNWWWGLHSLHHSQRNMNLWSDERNHLLDALLRDAVMALVALGIGVPPGQYLLLLSLSRMLQSLQHANVRLHFGRVGERLLVSPRYHRMHHAIGVGHESKGRGTLGGCNFAALLPVWDIVFGTANFTPEFAPTGVRGQYPTINRAGLAIPGRDYGRGYWSQQWLGLKRMADFMRRGPD